MLNQSQGDLVSILDSLRTEEEKFWLHLIFSYLLTAESKPSVKVKLAEFGLGFENYSIAVTRYKIKYPPVKEFMDEKPTLL